jgi:transposase
MSQEITTDTLGRRVSTRRHRPIQEKIAMVMESQQPGASVAEVARRHGVNANVLFLWRRLHGRGLLESHTRRGSGRRLVPVKLLGSDASGQGVCTLPVAEPLPQQAKLQVRFVCGAELSIQGSPDAPTLERLIRLLRC